MLAADDLNYSPPYSPRDRHRPFGEGVMTNRIAGYLNKIRLEFACSCKRCCNCRFSLDVTKMQTTKLLILLIFYSHDV